MRIWISLIFIFVFSLSAAAQTQAEMNAKICGGYRKADLQLNQLYQQLLTLYAKDAIFLKAFKASQLTWLKFRDAQEEALYPKRPNEDKRLTYGSMYPLLKCEALTSLTSERNKQLKAWVVGADK